MLRGTCVEHALCKQEREARLCAFVCLSRLGVEDDLAYPPPSFSPSTAPSQLLMLCVLLLVVFNALFCVATLNGNNP